MNQRFKEIRSALGLTQQEFADMLGTGRANVAGYETGRRSPSSSVISLVCEKCNVNEEWLRTGEGEMFLPILEEDEVAAYVSELLEDNGENPLYIIIKEIMHTYSELSPKSQEVIRDASAKLLENLQKRKED
ncbi:MAG TPA: helix-turn-helix domain-containing protein [Candidatus Anaerobutyricum faecale]|nr:helix-turn-helix domain-containing protein [Candidatus Anaerobutyricum faecale]